MEGLANHLMHEILGRSLDELPPQTRRFRLLLEEMVRKACEKLGISQTAYRFHRRSILDDIGWTYDQVRVHLERLTELEYVLIHGGHQGRRISYEPLYDGRGKDGRPFVYGLFDVEAIRAGKSMPTTEIYQNTHPAAKLARKERADLKHSPAGSHREGDLAELEDVERLRDAEAELFADLGKERKEEEKDKR